MESAIPTNRFDRNFVFAAVAIGGVYALIVVGLGALAGKEAAGVAGVALTALATGIFKQFETLRFRQIAQSEHVDVAIAEIQWSRAFVFAMSLFGLKFIAGMLLGVLAAVMKFSASADGAESFFQVLTNWRVLVSLVGANTLAYLFGGFIIARAFRIPAYSTLLVAALLSIALDTFLPILTVAVVEPSALFDAIASATIWPAAFWLVYLAVTLMGAKFANRRWQGTVPMNSAKGPTR